MDEILKPIPADLPEDIEQFEIKSKIQIVSYIKNLQAKHQLISTGVTGSTESALIAILQVDEESSQIVFDAPREPQILSQLIAATQPIVFDSDLDQVRIIFYAKQVRLIDYLGRKGLAIAIPNCLARIQRREFFRVETPQLVPATCSIPIDDQNPMEVIKLKIKNISLGGVFLVDDTDALKVEIGDILKNCDIHLSNGQRVVVDLEVRNFQTEQNRKGRKIGCRFIRLNSRYEYAVHRYITEMERTHLNKRKI